MQRPPLPPRPPPPLPAAPPLGPPPPPPLPPLSSVPLGGPPLLGGGGPLLGGSPPFGGGPPLPPVRPLLPGLPDRGPYSPPRGCWVDRCCAAHHYCSSLHASGGCQLRKREGAACVGDSARECENETSCVNGECSAWFMSRSNPSDGLISISQHVDIHTVCAPWQQFEYSHSSSSAPPSSPSSFPPMQQTGMHPLEKDFLRTIRRINGKCITLDKKACSTDRECWGLGGFGFCDVRSNKCRSPSYPSCLPVLKELYACLWTEGRMRESTENFIVSPLPQTPQFVLHQSPISVNHLQSKCMPSFVMRKRAELLKCVQKQGFTLERIVELPEEWEKL
ncbi:hypothetical protein Efla_001670 [Eimeria flavescens]